MNCSRRFRFRSKPAQAGLRVTRALMRPYNIDADAVAVFLLLVLGTGAAICSRHPARWNFWLLSFGDYLVGAWVLYYHCRTLRTWLEDRGFSILLAVILFLLIVGYMWLFARGYFQ